MIWDVLLLQSLRDELEVHLRGIFISSVRQVHLEDFFFECKPKRSSGPLDHPHDSAGSGGGSAAVNLSFSLRAGLPLLRLTSNREGAEPYRGWLRTIADQLIGGCFKGVDVEPLCRLLTFTIITQTGIRTLAAELDPRFPNAALVDESGTVLACYRIIHTNHRSLAPGERYKPPVQLGSLDPRRATGSEWEAALSALPASLSATESIFRAAAGLSRHLAAEFARACGLDADVSLAALGRAVPEALTPASELSLPTFHEALPPAYEAHLPPVGEALTPHALPPTPAAGTALTPAADPSPPTVHEALTSFAQTAATPIGTALTPSRTPAAGTALTPFAQALAAVARAALANHEPLIRIYRQSEAAASPEPAIISAIELHPGKSWTSLTFSSVSSALQTLLTLQSGQHDAAALRAHALRRIEAEIRTLRQKMSMLEIERERCLGFELERLRGELVTNNIYRLKKGDREVTALNYRQDPPEELTAPLDPAHTPAENARRYFKLAARFERGLAVCRQRLEAYGHKLTELEKRHAAVQTSTDQDLLQQWGNVASQGRSKTRSAELKEPQRLPYRRFLLFDRWETLIGRSGKDNHELLTAHTRADDVWLHIRGYSGSHVIIRNPQRRTLPPPEVLRRAAELAAFFSKAAKGSYLPVIYTFRKYVVPIKGAKAGAVRCQREEVVFVDPTGPREVEMTTGDTRFHDGLGET